MMTLAVLLVTCCLGGAVTAFLLEPRRNVPGENKEKEIDMCGLWSHVEQGPDTLFP